MDGNEWKWLKLMEMAGNGWKQMEISLKGCYGQKWL